MTLRPCFFCGAGRREQCTRRGAGPQCTRAPRALSRAQLAAAEPRGVHAVEGRGARGSAHYVRLCTGRRRALGVAVHWDLGALGRTRPPDPGSAPGLCPSPDPSAFSFSFSSPPSFTPFSFGRSPLSRLPSACGSGGKSDAPQGLRPRNTCPPTTPTVAPTGRPTRRSLPASQTENHSPFVQGVCPSGDTGLRTHQNPSFIP